MLKDKILSYLHSAKGAIVSGGEMANHFAVSRTAVWKSINTLKSEGYIITTHKNSGYSLSKSNDLVSVKGIQSLLTTTVFGREIEHIKSIPSTNSYLKNLELSSLDEGYTVIADCQTGGRGRMGRSFFSPEREGLYISFLLKPALPPEDIQLITVCAALAVSYTMERLLGIQTGIKWVNDIFYNGKKLCGILTEAIFTAELNRIENVIVGIGINTGKVANEVKNTATSLQEITGKKGYREELAAILINEFEQVYFAFTQHGKKEDIVNAYRDRMFIIGKKVMINNFSKIYSATVKGIDNNALLVVKTDCGKQQTLRSGDISLIL